MANFQAAPKGKMAPRTRAWIAIGALFIATALLGKAAWNIYQKNRVAAEGKQATLKELAELEARKANLEAKLGRLKTSFGVEEEIRRSFPVAKEGEHLIVVVDKEGDEASDTRTAGAPTTTRPSLWQALFRAGAGR